MKLPLPLAVSNEQIIPQLRGALLAKGSQSTEVAQWVVSAAADPNLLNAAREWVRLTKQIEGGATASPAPSSKSGNEAVMALFQMLMGKTPDPEFAVRQLAQIALDFPDQLAGALQMVAEAPEPSGTLPNTSQAAVLKPNGMAVSTLVVSLGTYVTTNRDSLSKQVDQGIAMLHIQDLPTSEFWGLLAVCGFLGGLSYGYSTFDGNWLPRIGQIGKESGIFILGLFGKALAGSLASLLLYFSSSPITGGMSNVASTSHVTGTTLVTAFLAGLAGANWITMNRDWPLLAKSAKDALNLSAAPEVAQGVKQNSLKSILEGVQQATAAEKK